NRDDTMKPQIFCAKLCRSSRTHDNYVVLFAVCMFGCGGSTTTTTLQEPGLDASSDAPHSHPIQTDGGSKKNRTTPPSECKDHPQDGSPCATEGETCGGDCSDPCNWCNVSTCVGGHWSTMEAFPMPYCDSRMSWQAPGGIAGTGPAFVLEGRGLLR